MTPFDMLNTLPSPDFFEVMSDQHPSLGLAAGDVYRFDQERGIYAQAPNNRLNCQWAFVPAYLGFFYLLDSFHGKALVAGRTNDGHVYHQNPSLDKHTMWKLEFVPGSSNQLRILSAEHTGFGLALQGDEIILQADAQHQTNTLWTRKPAAVVGRNTERRSHTGMNIVDAPNWMWGVEDATSIHEMSIPGTHESCARHGAYSQCQDHTITEQLERGVRFLDIRCRYTDAPDFPIYHHNDPQEINFLDVQRACIQFLAKYPSETILMNVQQEVTDEGPPFGTKFMALINPFFWSLGTTIPTLNDVRGRIVLIRANDGNSGWSVPGRASGPGLPWTGFNHSGVTRIPPFETQNQWDGISGTNKGALVETQLDIAVNRTENPDWIQLNFLSYAPQARSPNDIGPAAKDMNKRILGTLQTRFPTRPKRLGVLPMDYCGNTGNTGGGSLEDEIVLHNRFKAGYSYLLDRR